MLDEAAPPPVPAPSDGRPANGTHRGYPAELSTGTVLRMSMYDIDGDGFVDPGVSDTTGDGVADTNAVDTTGEGVADTWLADRDQDGFVDARAYDTTGNGVMDVVDDDVDEDGFPERRVLDVNEDGWPDATAPAPNLLINPDGSMVIASPYEGSSLTDLSDPAAVDAATGAFGDDIMAILAMGPPGGSPAGGDPGTALVEGQAALNNAGLAWVGPEGYRPENVPGTSQTTWIEEGHTEPQPGTDVWPNS